MDAVNEELKRIGKAWCEETGWDEYPPGGGPALEKWQMFKAGWIAANSDESEFLKRQLIAATKQSDTWEKLAKTLADTGDPKPWKIDEFREAWRIVQLSRA